MSSALSLATPIKRQSITFGQELVLSLDLGTRFDGFVFERVELLCDVEGDVFKFFVVFFEFFKGLDFLFSHVSVGSIFYTIMISKVIGS